MTQDDTLKALLRKARDFIEFSPIFGSETTNLVCEIDAALADVPRTGMWTPEVTIDKGGLTVRSMRWDPFNRQ